ncbi:CD9 antigen-like [Eucyclogobius newberryi]|uniref:CD9 antigen-like n=1 Tax=Eucyclogobius newberryi TaxID=166745 RepID=UPI003B5B2271
MGGLRKRDLCVKYLLFVFNFILWLAGLGVLGVGLWLRFDSKTSGLFGVVDSPKVFLTGVYILISAGVLMTVIGFLGCCGAMKESPCMLGLFFVFLFIVFLLEVAGGIWGFVNRDTVIAEVTGFYQQTYNNTLDHMDQDALTKMLTLIQFGLHCCGPAGNVAGRVPEKAKVTCPKKEGTEAIVETGCVDAIEKMFANKLHMIGGVGLGIALVMVFGLIFSMLLLCAIRKSRNFA